MNGVRILLGSWRCRSGNGVDVYVEPDTGDGWRRLSCAWDSPPPLSAEDLLDYRLRIFPAIAERAREYLEVLDPALAVLRL